MKPTIKRFLYLYLTSFIYFYIFWALYNYQVRGDTEMYLQMGKGVFQEFTFGYRGMDGQFHPMAFRMPLVPVIMGFFRFLTGKDALAYFFFSLYQVFLAAILPCLAFYFGDKINRKTAWGAFVFLLLHQNLLSSTLQVLTDMTFAAASGISFLFLWKGLEKEKNRDFFLSGFVAGIAFLVRPIMKFYIFIVVFFMLSFNKDFKSRLKIFSFYLAAFILPIAPWLIRNTVHYHTFVIETNQGLNMLWSHWNLVEIKEKDSSEIKDIKRKILNHGSSLVNVLTYNGWQYWVENDLKVSRKLQEIAKETWLDHPWKVMQNWFRNFYAGTFSNMSYYYMGKTNWNRPFYWKIRNSGILEPENFHRKSFHLYCEMARLMKLFYIFLAPVGLILLFFRNRKIAVFIFFNILYFMGLTAFVAGNERYRLNLEIFFAVIIMYPLVTLITRVMNMIQNRNKKDLQDETEYNHSDA